MKSWPASPGRRFSLTSQGYLGASGAAQEGQWWPLSACPPEAPQKTWPSAHPLLFSSLAGVQPSHLHAAGWCRVWGRQFLREESIWGHRWTGMQSGWGIRGHCQHLHGRHGRLGAGHGHTGPGRRPPPQRQPASPLAMWSPLLKRPKCLNRKSQPGEYHNRACSAP